MKSVEMGPRKREMKRSFGNMRVRHSKRHPVAAWLSNVIAPVCFDDPFDHS
ncbi:MAG: hypothetical protein ACXV5E_08130 [Halobacteriota archaeon]